MSEDDGIEKSDEMKALERVRKSRDEIDSEIGDIFANWNFLREKIRVRIGQDKYLEQPIQQMLAMALTVAFEELVVRELEINPVLGNDQES